MDWTGHWIWTAGDPDPWDAWVAARRTFTLDADPQSSTIRITADTRYVLWVNGKRVGQGPSRGWPWAWQYDTYNLNGFLTKGANTVAVLVMHYGIGTFQSLPTRAGLLAEVVADSQIAAATDTRWAMAPFPGRTKTAMPRITCQQGWTEMFDARVAGALDWVEPAYDDSSWDRAVDIGAPGTQPWEKLVPRQIPFLTEDPIYPVNIRSAELTTRPSAVWGMELRRNLIPGVKDANKHRLCGMLVAAIEADSAGEMTLLAPLAGNYAPGVLRVNGRDVEAAPGTSHRFDPGTTFRFPVQPGPNLLVWDVTGEYHAWSAAWVVNSGSVTYKQLPVCGEATWATFGPFESTEDEAFKTVWNAESVEQLAAASEVAKPVTTGDLHPVQPFLDSVYSSRVSELNSKDFSAACVSSADCASITASAGGDTRILLDFGRMTVGFWELEIADAPAGVEIDLCGFESIQEGHHDYTWGLNNAVRYITRAGQQSYHSPIRRGCRYLLLTVHYPEGAETSRSVDICCVRTIQNTYPCVERGSFESNDHQLNQIWKMGQYTTRLCSEDTYVDCPTYEQTFWVGDARNEGAVNHWAFGEYDLSRRCLLLAADSLRRSPLVESQVPSSWQDILPTWSLLWVLACEEYWQVTGDGAFLSEIYPAVATQTRNLLSMVKDDGLLWVSGWNLLDWAPLDTPGDGACTHSSAWFALLLERQIVMAEAIGRTGDITELTKARESIITAINTHLWSNEHNAYVDSKHADGSISSSISQQTNTVVLLAGCATPERADKIRALVVEAPEGVVRVGSPFFMFFSFEALAGLGEQKTILDLTRKWWGYMLDTGATTCWETFPGFEAAGRYTRSHCHAWSAAPTYFLSRYQLGVSPLKPGFTRVSIAPLPSGLDWARGKVPTPHGEISVDWRYADGHLHLNASLPGRCSAVVRLPGDAEDYGEIRAEGVGAGQSPTEFEGANGATVAIVAELRQTTA